MKLTHVVLMTLVLAASTLALAPSAEATSCAAEPEELEPMLCGVVYAYFCITDEGTPSHKTVASCVL